MRKYPFIIFFFLIFSSKQTISSTRKSDIQKFLIEKIPSSTFMNNLMISGKLNGFFSTEEVDEIFEYLSQTQSKYVKTKKIGTTTQNLDIYAYHLSTSFSNSLKKSKILITGLHHSREVIIANVIIKVFLETLHSLIHNGPNLTYFQFCDLIIVPIINKDGHNFISNSYKTADWSINSLKRKNMNSSYCQLNKKKWRKGEYWC